MTKVIKFYPKDAAENPDAVLEQAIGNYDEVLILGWDKDGNLDARSSLNVNGFNALWLTQKFTHKLMNGDYTDES